MFELVFMTPCFTVLVPPSILALVMQDLKASLFVCAFIFFSQNQNGATHISL